MTASTQRQLKPRVRAAADLRRFDRVVAAILMPIGPAAAAVIRFVIPALPVSETVPADPGAQRLVLGLGLVAVFTLIPGAYAALHLLRRAAPRLTAWTGALLIPGYLGMTALFASDAFAMAAYDAGLGADETDRVADAIMSLPTMTAMLLIFVVGHIVGTVLLGVTMIVTRAAPLAIGVLMTISQPLHLTAILIGSRPLDLFAWGATAVGMGFLAWKVLHTADEDWELPPRSRS